MDLYKMLLKKLHILFFFKFHDFFELPLSKKFPQKENH